MPKMYVNVAGTWKTVQLMSVKKNDAWTSVSVGYVFQDGIGKQFYPDSIGATTYVSTGSYSYTVPSTVTQIEITSTGSGGGGSAYYFNAGSGNISAGGNGNVTTVTSTGLSITSGAGGGGATGTVGTNSITGAVSTSVNQNGGSPSGTTGGSSYFGSGSGGGGDNSKPATPTASGAGGGGGYYQNNATQGGYAGATQVSVFNVTPGQIIYISVGAGGIGPEINYNQGSGHWSRAGNGADGYVKIRPLNANSVTYTTGTNTFTVPTGVNSLNVTVVGGGGSGGAAYQSGGTTYGGNNGAGGTIVSGSLTVTPGQVLTIRPGGGAGVARGSWVGGTGGSGGVNDNASYNGAAGTTNGNGGGGGAGASSVISGSTGLVIVVAAGGAGGQGAVSAPGGSGGSAGSNTVPSYGLAVSTSTGTNYGTGATPVASYSGSYSNGTGASQLSGIQSTIVATYPFLYTPGGSIGAVNGGGNDWNFPMTLGDGVNLLARGSVLNYDNAGGAFAVGRTVSGINFAYGNTQANGGQSFNFYTGMIPSAGTAGYITISY